MPKTVVVVALLAVIAASPVLAQQAPPKSSPPKAAAPAPEKPAEKTEQGAETAKVDGFRSANFGMTEQQVRNAIRKDFGLSGDKVSADEQADKTTVLSITVPEKDLLPDIGPARVSYVFGFKSKKLMQVSLAWGAPGHEVSGEKLGAAAGSLRDFFLTQNFPAENRVVNGQASDGSVVVFRGVDAQKRTVLLRVIGGKPEGENQKPQFAMRLDYVLDIQNMDVFKISKGQF
jgi:hypothetical protein